MTVHHQLVLDIQTMQSPQFAERGIPRYTGELSLALLRAGAPVTALALNPVLPFPARLNPELARAPQLCWNTAAMLRRAAEAGPVAYHVMSPFEGPRPVQTTLPPYALGNDVRLVCTLYDLIPEIFEVYEPGSQLHRLYQQRLEMLRRAELLVTISESTERDAVRILGVDPSRVAMVGAGASAFFRRPEPDERPRDLLAEHLPEIDRPYVLAVTGVFGLDKRKNTEVLIDAFGQLPPAMRASHQLVVTCKLTDRDRQRWLDQARSAGLADRTLVLTDYVSDEVLRALYQEARLFAYPSLYEGFGLPALEAARCGCATITSNTSSLPEVLDWEPATFDPTDTDSVAAAIARALSDDGFRGQLLEAAEKASQRHTWERVAARTIEAYRRLDPPGIRRRRRRLRLGLIGPFPPSDSAVARYDQSVAEALSEHCEVDCFAESDARSNGSGGRRAGRPPPSPALRRFPIRALGSVLSPSSYDALVYVLGNSHHHHRTYEMFLHFPGIAWFHDVSLSAMYLAYARHRLPPEEVRAYMQNTLRHHYWERAAKPLSEGDSWGEPDHYEMAGARMTGAIGSRSQANIVGTDLARSLMVLDAGPFTEPSPTFVVPLAVPPAPDRTGEDSPPRALERVEGRLVVALGTVTRQTRPDVVVEAAARVAAAHDVTLAFVGTGDDDLVRDLMRQARALGLGGRVTVTGHLEPADHGAWVARASCAVQLRSDAGASGGLALMDAVGAGRAVITSATASLDLSEGTVQRVPADVTASDLARELAAVLDDEQHRTDLEDGARRHSADSTFEVVADRLIEIAGSLSATRGEPHP